MQRPSTQRVLAAWEQGRAAPRQTERALALLSAAYTDVPRAAIAQLAIGARDRLLLALHGEMFGSRLMAVTPCPACQALLELEFDADDVTVASGDETMSNSPDQVSVSRDGYDVAIRIPNSFDVLGLREKAPDEENKMRLIQRLVLHASLDGREIATSQLPPALIEELDQCLGRADPQADIRLSLNCAACGLHWQAPFDIVSYLWNEVDAWAIRILRDVHQLARAYGWREADILALSSWRRQCYLNMLGE